MALTAKSKFLYGIEVTALNNAIDFKTSAGGSVLMATLTIGFYSLTAILNEIKRAMQEVDPSNTYTVTADRTVMGGLENRITIATSGAFLSLLFASGPRTTTTVAPLIGFTVADQTGSTSYTGTSSAGTVLVPDYVGYNYLGTDFMKKVNGAVNISASGVKEAVVFQVQHFWQVQFKYEPQAKVISEWSPFLEWAIQQRLLEFTPEISSPNSFYEGTLEKTSDDGKALGYKMTEMLPNYPFNYDTGLMTFRLNEG